MSDFSSLVRSWLRADPADRDLKAGAMLTLRIHGNEGRYNATVRNLAANAADIERQLREYISRRDAIPSREEARQIRREAEALVKSRGMAAGSDGSISAAAEFKAGKRADHDSLPEHVQLIFEQNMALKRRMSQYHLEIRNLLKSTKDCADADLKAIVTLLKEADVTYRNNWKAYDSYGKDA